MEQLVSTPLMITLVIVLMATLGRTAALVRIEFVCFSSSSFGPFPFKGNGAFCLFLEVI